MYSILDDCQNYGQTLLDLIDLDGELCRISLAPSVTARDFFNTMFPELSPYRHHFTLVRTVGEYSLSIALDIVPMFLYDYPGAKFSIELRSVSADLCVLQSFPSLLQRFVARQLAMHPNPEFISLMQTLRTEPYSADGFREIVAKYEALEHPTFTVFLADHSITQITIVLSADLVRVIVSAQQYYVFTRASVRFEIRSEAGQEYPVLAFGERAVTLEQAKIPDIAPFLASLAPPPVPRPVEPHAWAFATLAAQAIQIGLTVTPMPCWAEARKARDSPVRQRAETTRVIRQVPNKAGNSPGPKVASDH
jgi:hypothetical protein